MPFILGPFLSVLTFLISLYVYQLNDFTKYSYEFGMLNSDSLHINSYFTPANIYNKKTKQKNVFYWERTRAVFVCVEVLRPSQPSGVMSSAVSLPNNTFTGQA